MRLPGGPDRSTGAGDRARLEEFRLRRGLTPEDGPAYAAARLAALDALAPGDGPAWRPLGPFAIPHGRTAGFGPGSRPRVAGRVTAVAVDPADPRHLLAGGGGVWESRDGGRSWRPRTDDQPTPAIGALAFAPGDPAVAYAGTGQGEALAALGVGLLRSDDGGASWRPLAADELLGAGFFDLLVDPADPDRLLAATTAGLLGSADGGAGWERRLAGRCWTVSAGAGGELLAGDELGLHRSEDGGATWRRLPLASAPESLDRVAVAHGASGRVAYVFAAGEGVGHLWRREGPDGPFEPVKPPPDLHSRQAWHSWACAADPGDPEVVWLGAAGLHRGTRGPDGRWSWVDLTARPSGDSLPLGQHAVVFEPGGAVCVANEGGLYRSTDGGSTWRSLGTGLAVAEVRQLVDHGPWLLAGTGALGTLRYEGGEVWCPVGAADPAVVVGGELVEPGAGGLVVSADGGASWTAVPLPGVRGAVTALAAAGADRLLAGTAEGELLRLERAAGGWAVAVVARPRAGAVAGVAADPGRPGVAWAAWTGPGSGRVWRSEDAGATWVDRGRSLPEVPVAAVAPDPERPGTVLVATDAGVWWSRDDGEDWRPLGRGLPNAPVLALAVRPGERLVRAGLLGRGVWELPLDPEPGPAVATPALRSARSPAARPRPGGPWWECPDIKVEVPPRPRQEPVEPVEFEDDRWPGTVTLPETGGRVEPGHPARIHVQVHHRGDGSLSDVRVRVLAAPASLRLPDVPVGPWLATAANPPRSSPWRPVGPPAALGGLDPGRSAVATVDWIVPPDLPRDLCFLAVATAGGVWTTGAASSAGGVWTTGAPDSAVGLPSRSGTPRPGGWGSDAPGDPGISGWSPGVPGAEGRGSAPATEVGIDPADLVTTDGRWGCQSVTALRPGRGRVVRLDLLGAMGRGPFGLAAEGWVTELTGGVVLPRGVAGLAREAGLAPERVGEPWRPEVVGLVREDPSLAQRLDLTAFALPAGRRDGGLDLWLRGMELAPDRADPLLLLLGDPPPSGRGSLLLLDADGGVLGGHTFRVAG
jgi:photosystem II stability/assembly factor-like uncharacterized protein